MKPEDKYIYSEQALEMYEIIEKMESKLTSRMSEIKASKSWTLKIIYPWAWVVSKLATRFKNHIANNPRKYSKGTYNSFSDGRKELLDKYLKELEKLEKLK
jgi:hypothetical protein